MRYKRFAAALLGVLLLLTAGLATAQTREVRVYNWTDYIDPAVLEQFTRETGIRVVYDTYDSNEILEAKLLAGSTGYDIVAPTSNFLARHIQAGLLRPLDRARLANWGNLDAELMGRLARYDADNRHGAIYLWGTTGIGLNADKIRQRMRNAPIRSLAMIFDPAVVSRFADCGVNLLDAPDEIIPAVLLYLGENPDAKDARALGRAEEHLLRIRPHIRRFHSSQYINDLASGEICLAFGWSGDIVQAKSRAEEARAGVRVQYLLPREGAQMWFDVLAIPRDAPNPENAHALIDFLMRPQVIAAISDKVQYPNANRASWPLVSREARADADIWPQGAALSRLFSVTPNTQAQQRLFTRIWTRVKAGN
ncbi:MAG: polyamine ABC transporter substrate-binding protein [Alphaproteobacteria bacterium]|nr:polyamine ABC transporter substrate-binding protein [Alphaproteobacteria bacterium]